MKALVLDRYGDLGGFRLTDLPLPEPGAGEIRVRVHASALNPSDFKVALGQTKFLHARNFPMVLGYDFSGAVEAIGSNIDQLAAGSEVFGFLPYSPLNRRGAFAESLIARANEVALKPAQVTHAEAAAAATPGLTALQSLRDLGRIDHPGMKVLINGVSGGVGSIAVGIAKRLGAHVTAVGSDRGLEYATALGADRVVNRKQGDPLNNCPGPYDVVFDAAAVWRGRQWRSHLTPRGAYITTLPSLNWAVDKLTSLFGGPSCDLVTVKSKPADLHTLGEWLSGGLTIPAEHFISLAEVPQYLAMFARGELTGRAVVQDRG